MVALCERKPTKVDTPKKREIREKMFAAEIRGEAESLSERPPQSRDDRMSLMAKDLTSKPFRSAGLGRTQASRADIRRTRGHRPRHRARGLAAARVNSTCRRSICSAIARSSPSGRKSWDCRSSLPMLCPRKRSRGICESPARGGDRRNRHRAPRTARRYQRERRAGLHSPGGRPCQARDEPAPSSPIRSPRACCTAPDSVIPATPSFSPSLPPMAAARRSR